MIMIFKSIDVYFGYIVLHAGDKLYEPTIIKGFKFSAWLPGTGFFFILHPQIMSYFFLFKIFVIWIAIH